MFYLNQFIGLYLIKKMSFKMTWCAALVAACTLEIFIILFLLHVTRFMGNYAGKSIIDHPFFFSINIYFVLKRTNWFRLGVAL